METRNLDGNSSVFAQSRYLKNMLSSVTRTLDDHSLQFQAMADYWQKVVSGPPMLVFSNGQGGVWRPAMAKEEALGHASSLVNVAAVHAIVMMAGALDYYLYKMCEHLYVKSDLVDRKWFSLDMVDVISGVKLSECLSWPQVSEMLDVWIRFCHPEDYDVNPMVNANREVIKNYSEAVAIFAIDWERALCLANPRMRLPL
jgi:hypothetical protein